GANPAALIRDSQLSLRQGAIAAWPELDDGNPFTRFAEAVAQAAGFSLDTPFQELGSAAQRAVLHGTGEAWIELPGSGVHFQYRGLSPAIDEASRVSPAWRHKLDHLVSEVACSTCHGSRLRDDAAATRFQDRTLGDVGQMPLGETL